MPKKVIKKEFKTSARRSCDVKIYIIANAYAILKEKILVSLLYDSRGGVRGYSQTVFKKQKKGEKDIVNASI